MRISICAAERKEWEHCKNRPDVPFRAVRPVLAEGNAAESPSRWIETNWQHVQKKEAYMVSWEERSH